VIWHFVRAEASLATGEPQAALDEVQRGLVVNPSYGQLDLAGAVAAWRLGAQAVAREWIEVLRQHPAFATLEAVRLTIGPTFDPSALGQLERLLDTLREAGIPAG
jgi:hypothetical protein